MSNFVGQNIRLSELPGRPKALLQFLIEAQVDIDLLVFGTVKRPARRLGHATCGIDTVAEQHQLRMPVGHALAAQNLGPGFLGIVEHERHKLHHRLFLLVAHRIGLARLNGTSHAAATTTATYERQKIALEYDAQHQQDQKTANPDVPATDVETTASAAFVSAIFQIIAAPTRSPTHQFAPQETGRSCRARYRNERQVAAQF